MFASLKKVVIWQYGPTISEVRLRRGYRIAGAVVYAWTTAAVVTVSSFAEVVLFRGSSTLPLIALAVASALAVILSVPGIVAVFWAVEIEKVLTHRGLVWCALQSMEKRMGIAAMKMVLWVAILLLAFHFVITPAQA